MEDLILHPRENPYLTGHEAVEKLLLEAIANQTIAGSWLITGPKGIGKATLAYRLARYLFAYDNEEQLFGEGDSSLYLSKEHSIFHRMVSGGLGDMITVEVNHEEGRSEITVDEIRQVGKFLSQTASESRWRVVIIDAADEMNRNASNALLKILEEPPKNTVILLVSHCPGKLLPTIRSRCRFVKLRPLEQKKVMDLLGTIDEDLHPKAAEFASVLSNGSPGMAIELYMLSGLELYEESLSIFSTLPSLEVTAIQVLGDKLAGKDNYHQWRMTTYLLEWFLAKAVRSKITGEKYREFITDENTICQKLQTHYSVDQLVKLWEKIGQIVAQSDGLNIDRKLATQQIFGAFIK